MLLEEIQTRSDTYSEVLQVARKVALTDVNVLITGETGSGKDFLSGLIHNGGARRSGPFLKIDCASIPYSLAESEFFGYEKGAFSDASDSKLGKLQMAAHGTLYLDGINHLSTPVQSKLLRFVQDRIVEPLGSSKSYYVDCRLIASCSLPLKTCLEQKQLRDDLYYRLSAIVIDLPPLRERLPDMEILTAHILAEANEKYRKRVKISPEAFECLKQYRWPGNIRELRNVLEEAVIRNEELVLPAGLRFQHSIASEEQMSYSAGKLLSLDDLERLYIAQVLQKVKGHQSKAARILKINRKTLLMKRRKYGLDKAKG